MVFLPKWCSYQGPLRLFGLFDKKKTILICNAIANREEIVLPASFQNFEWSILFEVRNETSVFREFLTLVALKWLLVQFSWKETGHEEKRFEKKSFSLCPRELLLNSLDYAPCVRFHLQISSQSIRSVHTPYMYLKAFHFVLLFRHRGHSEKDPKPFKIFSKDKIYWELELGRRFLKVHVVLRFF